MTRCSAVLLAAGKGTRMRSDLPKVLHPFRGEPLALHVVRAARSAGADPIVVVVGHGAEQVREILAVSEMPEVAGRAPLRFAEQAEQLGTGHAVQCALPMLEGVSGTVLVLSGDVPLIRAASLRALVDACRRSSAGLALGVFEPADNQGYGRILRDGSGSVVGIREQRDASAGERAIRECNAGTYCVDVDRLRAVLPTVRRDNAQGEIYLTDIVAPLAETGAIVAVMLEGYEAAGVNTPEDLAALEALGPG